MLNTLSALPPLPQSRMQKGFVVLFLLVLIELSVLIWTAYDQSIPCWDTAVHRLNSLKVFGLLQHPHLRNLSWYRDIFAVSQLYPPFFYILSAFLKFIFGRVANTELAANCMFIAILFCSLYCIAKVSYKTELSALLAALLVFLYPAIYWSTHCASLDCATNAMVAAGLACFIWWDQNPTKNRSIILGLTLGLATLTKNNVPIFFAGPILIEIFFAFQRQKQSSTQRDYLRIKQLFIVFLTTSIVILPWLLLAGPAVFKFIGSIQQQIFSTNNYVSSNAPIYSFGAFPWLAEFLTHLHWFTLLDLPLILSPLLFAGFVLTLIWMLVFKIQHLNRTEILMLACLVFALLIASIFRWPHQYRYITPVAIPIAVLTSGMFAHVWLEQKKVLRLGLLIIAVVSFVQFIYTSFSPYPITLPSWINAIVQMSGENFKTHSFIGQLPGASVSPISDSNSSIFWSLSKIELAGSGAPTSLMVMPSTNPINCSAYYYLTKLRKDNIEVASPRQNTELGDKVSFNSQRAQWYKWYILKTGDQGKALCDNESAIEYAKWLQFVHTSGLYKLFDKKTLPDSSILELYRAINH